MAEYAKATKVSPEKSRAEIESTLKRYGCDGFMFGWEESRAVIVFRAHDRTVRFELTMPDREDFRRTPAQRQRRTEAQTDAAYDQGIRQRWRALALAIKAKLEAVESEIVTFDEEFLAHFVLADGQTVGQRLGPELDALPRGGSLLGVGSGAPQIESATAEVIE